ncbi:DEHA2G13816p [Debaryomyces hansenii CBS767]|uniref:DEHA2G13816p n=1 Tax=Debaryomyces hansenii (strain ATCC 36239 / CBS 767 / BCRC 21394 / JCM 1990 / NBRC 0083 / IGC 2968) TaxID=284592 RepID=B5RUS4_DEBHA|nr:DEHA2G13816p [Debaryomyces hansenii CBS767]CAR65968.1 DEHA2G13816p [Debaryomyces hansenii CBS767]|eukprot:XP_002770634.1 DEHA2G13816p [Debaryomyces hansenii CBS767]
METPGNGRSLIDPNYSSVTFFDNSKPREERNFKEIYPDLEESNQLKVFVLDNQNDQNNEVHDERAAINNLDLKKPSFRVTSKSDDGDQNIKFSKIVTDYGFQEPNRASHKVPSSTYIRPFSLNENEKIEDMIIKKKNQVEYDMDEQDNLYLQHRNDQTKNTIKLTPEVFEILITILENEWDSLEIQMSSISSTEDENNRLLTLDEGLDNNKYGNDDGIVVGSVVEQNCAVCNDSDCDNSNAIVFCDGCDIAVHQECYGIAFIPEGQWLCRKCMINKNREIDCVFCPSKTGAFKQLDNSLWSHVICALWINELYFANPIYMEPIEGVDLIPKSRWKLTCYICKQKVGACIQCCNRSCFQAYHVTCAKRAGLYMNLTKGIQGAINNKTTLKSFCDKHSPSDWDQYECIKGINKTRLFYRDITILNDQNARLTKNQKKANKLNIFKWKTENNTPIPPKLLSDRLFATLISLKVDSQPSIAQSAKVAMLKDLGYKPNRSREQILQEIRDMSNEICRYWCLKRESKKGATLIRKNNNMIATSSIVYGNSNYEEINNKIEVANILMSDLDKVIGLTSSNLSRQEMSKQASDLDIVMVDTVYFPIKRLLDVQFSKLDKLDANHLLINYRSKAGAHLTWSQIKHNIDTYEYTSIEQFNTDVSDFYHMVIRENKSTNNIIRVMKRIYKGHRNSLPHLAEIEKAMQNDYNNGTLKVPFVEVNGSTLKFSDYDPKQVIDLNDLSEVEEASENDNVLLHNFITGN